jgi:hypothetical protein
MAMRPTYENLEKLRDDIRTDAAILCGDEIGPSDASWQDVAGTMASNMRVYATLLDRLRDGEPVESFPSWDDAWMG